MIQWFHAERAAPNGLLIVKLAAGAHSGDFQRPSAPGVSSGEISSKFPGARQDRRGCGRPSPRPNQQYGLVV